MSQDPQNQSEKQNSNHSTQSRALSQQPDMSLPSQAGLHDSRPAAVQMKRLQHLAQQGPRALQMKAWQAKADDKPIGITGPTGSGSGLPLQLKSQMESMSGHSLDDVSVHYGSSQPAQLQAHAFAQGNNIHLAPGQEQHLAHEAWHVVQQKQGRVQPTTSAAATPVNDDPGLEREADQVAASLTTQTPDHQPVQRKAVSATGGNQSVVQRKVAVSIDAYEKEVSGGDIISQEQFDEYVIFALMDDVRYAQGLIKDRDRATGLDGRTKSTDDVFDDLLSIIQDTDSRDMGLKKVATRKLAVLVNRILKQNGKASNTSTRYTAHPAGGYAHSGDFQEWEGELEGTGVFTEGAGAFLREEAQESPASRPVDHVPVKQIPWDRAKMLLPRPLLNLLFDVRFQLGGGGQVVDERAEQIKTNVTPHEPGSIRSWHEDSSGMLPANGFDANNMPAHARTLHTHYTNTSSKGSGAGAGNDDGIQAPVGYAEYTGARLREAGEIQNLKIVLDYISKRTYVTFTHYQYWGIRNDNGAFESGGTQRKDQAIGRLNNEAGSGNYTLMNPWVEIVF